MDARNGLRGARPPSARFPMSQVLYVEDKAREEKIMSTEKFKALVHCIVHECLDNPGKLGAVRLNKALWFTDLISYQESGAPVTDEKYVKRKMGPVPATILRTLQELQQEGKIMVRGRTAYYDPYKYISLEEPDVSFLSDDDRRLAKVAISFVCGHTAHEISDFTHDGVWDAAREGEEIPLFATLASGRGCITDEVKAWAESNVEEIEGEKAAA